MSGTGTHLPQIGNYQAIALIHESDRTLVYRGQQIDNDRPIIIKLMAHEYPSFRELVQFRNQYAIAKNLEMEGIIKTHALQRDENRYALIMEDVGGVSLAEYNGKTSLSISQFLEIAMQLADILHYLHQNNIIHKDIKPANILICQETQRIKLIDFSISTLLPRETQTIQTPNILEGTLAYLSPEQTGRMNRGIDYRSDFYSVGVTFYELLTGNVPFSTEESLELIHAHIAQNPDPPSQWVSLEGKFCPVPLSDIVLKLMAKNAEDRYQSALGLKHDLEKCFSNYQETKTIEAFELGERDICDRFLIPEKLYGRENEVQALLNSFERVADGNSEMMLIAGFSGIGKTAIVNEVHKPIIRQKGYFIQGKFDQFNRNIPFFAFVQAFRSLMGQILGESDADLKVWKAKILEAIGDNGQVIIDVIPELEGILGQQPAVPELFGSAAQNRFNLLFSKFVRVFATKEHPLVIFLDDLQWADSASLNLLKLSINESRSGYLLVLGAYRDNEVFGAHPLILALDEMEKQHARINTLVLSPLDSQHITHLVADTLLCSLERAIPLSELVYQKTRGNPFFTTQFLRGLYEEECIVFNVQAGYWQCNLTKVRELALTDNVVEFMVGRLQKLSPATRDVLKIAACIGNQFDSETLAIVCLETQENIVRLLWQALQDGLIVPENETYQFFQGSDRDITLIEGMATCYRFLHDRVQQAAYQLIPEGEKQIAHYQIGQRLLEGKAEEQQEQYLLEIVNHLNQAIALFVDTSQRQQLIQLNLQAGQKAKKALAYRGASRYYDTACLLLSDRSWQSDYQNHLAVYSGAVETAFLCGNFPRMEEFAEILLQKAQTFLDRVKVYEIKVQAAIAQNQLNEAIQLGLDFLSHLDIHLPQQVTSSQIDAAFADNDVLLEDIAIEEVVHFDRMNDPDKEAAIRMITIVGLAMYIANPELLMLSVARQVNLCLQYGNTSTSADAYATYGLFLCGERGEIEKGYQFGKLAIAVLETLQTLEIKSLVYVLFNGFIKHWQDPCRDTLADLKNAYYWGLEMGDLQNAALSAYCYCTHQFLCGVNLSDLHPDIERYAHGVESIQQLGIKGWLDPLAALTRKLIEPSSTPLLLLSSVAAEEQALEAYRQDSDRTGIFIFAFSKMLLAYLWDRNDEAIASAKIAREYLDGITGMALVPCFYFYDTAILLSVDPTILSSEEKAQILDNQRKLQELCQYGESNLRHKSQLLDAEYCRWSGDRLRAIECYDRAIAGAKENEYIQEEALANECFAKFYLDWGREKEAALYIQEAYCCYAQWGAKAKTNYLEQRYPQLLKPILQRERTALSSGVTICEVPTIESKIQSSASYFYRRSLQKISFLLVLLSVHRQNPVFPRVISF